MSYKTTKKRPIKRDGVAVIIAVQHPIKAITTSPANLRSCVAIELTPNNGRNKRLKPYLTAIKDLKITLEETSIAAGGSTRFKMEDDHVLKAGGVHIDDLLASYPELANLAKSTIAYALGFLPEPYNSLAQFLFSLMDVKPEQEIKGEKTVTAEYFNKFSFIKWHTRPSVILQVFQFSVLPTPTLKSKTTNLSGQAKYKLRIEVETGKVKRPLPINKISVSNTGSISQEKSFPVEWVNP